MRVQADIAQLTDPIRAKLGSKKSRLTSGQRKVLQEMITAIRKLEVKPQKGRMRDLRRIHALVDKLNSMAEKWMWKD